MKRSIVLTKTQIIGIFLGITGFLMPLFVTIAGLSFAGHLALSIFLLAALFWMTEPIPIYATSILVIFLGVLLLSGQGPVFQNSELELTEISVGDNGHFKVPSSAINSKNEIYTYHGGKWVNTLIEIINDHGATTEIQSQTDLSGAFMATNYRHKLVGYSPGESADYMGTLANPIIILFLGGFMIAQAAVKYNFDKNLTKYLLKPFGTKPYSILIGLMLVTAGLSAFMSNTATTAMMMTVIIPILAQLSKEDLFKTALALSVPISANLGGIATPIGTPPNAIVLANLNQHGISITFTEWMFLTVPFVLIIVFLSWWILQKMFPTNLREIQIEESIGFNKSTKALVFYGIFSVTLILWVTESIHGISSTIVALLPITALALFEVLDVQDIRRLPWEVLWLVAGGLSLGIYLDQTGLANFMVKSIEWNLFSGFMVVSLFGFVAILLSNFLSNTVAATLLMPLAISIGILQGSGGVELIELALVIGVGTSLAIVLPISTPPNAIAISTGMVKTSEMARFGVLIGIIGLILMLIYAVLYWPILIT